MTSTAVRDPIFQSIFGESWNDLPPVIKAHYANRPYSNDRVIVEGTLDVVCSGPMKWLAPCLWLMRGIPPHQEQSVPVTVYFESDHNNTSFHFNRLFHFRTRKPYNFRSRMQQIKGNDVVELMSFGIGWRMTYHWENGRVKLRHKGYALHLLGCLIPLPLSLFLGKGYAEEIPVNDTTFDMLMHITHPWWGKIYGYSGRFSIKETE